MLKRGYKQLVEDALGRIHTLSVDEAQTKLGDPDVVFIDIREARELEREGAVPGAFNAPRGMLEFWVDPESPYHKEIFAPGKHFVLYCQSAWRSALATPLCLTWVSRLSATSKAAFQHGNRPAVQSRNGIRRSENAGLRPVLNLGPDRGLNARCESDHLPRPL